MSLTDDDVREILRIIDESPLDELRIETEGLSLHVVKGSAAGVTATASAAPAERTDPEPASPSPEPDASRAPAGSHDGLVTIDAPMLGTFYRAEGPGKEPFVDVGSSVEPDTIVGIIEVMKMMNAVPAGIAGTIVDICHENAQLVEYGQPLFRVRTA